MKCCLCKEEIGKANSAWVSGNNAWPLSDDGRCCDKCNIMLVMPARIQKLKEDKLWQT